MKPLEIVLKLKVASVENALNGVVSINDTFTVIYCQTIYQKKISNTQRREEIVQELGSVRAFCHENQENHRNRSTCINHFLQQCFFISKLRIHKVLKWLTS